MDESRLKEIDLMGTQEIIEYLARHRFSQGFVLAGIKNDNAIKKAEVFNFLKGTKEKLELIQMNINDKINERLYGN